MLTLLQTPAFVRWLAGLADLQAKARILLRLEAFGRGHAGDVKALGLGLHEMRVDVGGGYRLYLTHARRGGILLLWGGPKRSQRRDMAKARRLFNQWKESDE